MRDSYRESYIHWFMRALTDQDVGSQDLKNCWEHCGKAGPDEVAGIYHEACVRLGMVGKVGAA